MVYDVLIVGAGPSGMTAAIYAARAGLRVALVEKNLTGGMALSAEAIANYPGFLNTSGQELMQSMTEQVEACGVEILYGTAAQYDLSAQPKTVMVDGTQACAKTMILALGSAPKPLGIDGEQELSGNGISYCATCDGMFFKGKDVLVAGSGKTAIEDVKFLAPLVRKVYVLGKGTLQHMQDEAVEKLEHAYISQLIGNPLTGVQVRFRDGSQRQIAVSGLFVAQGRAPDTAAVRAAGVLCDSSGYMVTNESMETNVKGVYAAGDARVSPLKQIVTACADGAIAAMQAAKLVREFENEHKNS